MASRCVPVRCLQQWSLAVHRRPREVSAWCAWHPAATSPPGRLPFLKDHGLYCSNSPAANLCTCLLAVSLNTSTGQRPLLPLHLKGTPGPLQQCIPSRRPQKQSFIPVSNPFGPSHISKTRLDSLLLSQWGGCWLACCKPKLVAWPDELSYVICRQVSPGLQVMI